MDLLSGVCYWMLIVGGRGERLRAKRKEREKGKKEGGEEVNQTWPLIARGRNKGATAGAEWPE